MGEPGIRLTDSHYCYEQEYSHNLSWYLLTRLRLRFQATAFSLSIANVVPMTGQGTSPYGLGHDAMCRSWPCQSSPWMRHAVR